jgi:hypothetical protein
MSKHACLSLVLKSHNYALISLISLSLELIFVSHKAMLVDLIDNSLEIVKMMFVWISMLMNKNHDCYIVA